MDWNLLLLDELSPFHILKSTNKSINLTIKQLFIILNCYIYDLIVFDYFLTHDFILWQPSFNFRASDSPKTAILKANIDEWTQCNCTLTIVL